MALNLDLTIYQKAIDTGSALIEGLRQYNQPIPGYITDVISASQKILTLGQDASRQADQSRKFYLNQIQGAQAPIADIEWTAPVVPTANEFIAAVKAVLAPLAPPTPPTPKEVKK